MSTKFEIGDLVTAGGFTWPFHGIGLVLETKISLLIKEFNTLGNLFSTLNRLRYLSWDDEISNSISEMHTNYIFMYKLSKYFQILGQVNKKKSALKIAYDYLNEIYIKLNEDDRKYYYKTQI